MVQNYFNSDNGWNIVMNNTTPSVALLGGGYGRDWWYDVLPNALYYAICDVFPNVDGAEKIQKSIAEQFVKADSVLNGNYDYSYFDYAQMKGMVNHIPLQQDAAGGHAYVLLCAYHKFGDPRYLQHSKSAIEALLAQKESRFYEALLPLGVYTAAYLNAVEGANYDVAKLLDWVFDGCKSPTGRTGWGIIVGKWGDYDVSGLQGSITDGGGYAFLMNSIKPAWPFIPMVKYQPQYAKAIGKWMLNNASACRLFYPGEIDETHQWAPELKDITYDNVSYEGLRKTDDYGKASLKGVSPVAIGDGPKWIKVIRRRACSAFTVLLLLVFWGPLFVKRMWRVFSGWIVMSQTSIQRNLIRSISIITLIKRPKPLLIKLLNHAICLILLPKNI